jgi:cation diffusion facilitator family transporter
MTRKTRAASLSIASNSLLILLKIIAGILTGSVSLIAEAVHSSMDLAAAIIAFFSVRISDKAPDEKHPFGHGKAENISGVAEGILIFIAAIIIIYEAVHKIITGAHVATIEIGLGIMGLSIVVNILVSRYLMKTAKATDSLALEADAKHLTTDVLTMGGVLVGLALVRITGLAIFDPITALLVALMIIKAAFDITRKSFGGLIDTRLPLDEEQTIAMVINEHSGSLVGFHDMRTRKSGSHRFVELHLVMPHNVALEDAHKMCDHLEDHLKEELPNIDLQIHTEPCSSECELCRVSFGCGTKTGPGEDFESRV